jgi:hypothetical protein
MVKAGQEADCVCDPAAVEAARALDPQVVADLPPPGSVGLMMGGPPCQVGGCVGGVRWAGGMWGQGRRWQGQGGRWVQGWRKRKRDDGAGRDGQLVV